MSQWKQGVGQRRQWKAEEFDGLKPTVYDWVRMAAFLDGEGNMNINPIPRGQFKKRLQVRILIGNTNPALPIWLKETFGGNVILRHNSNPRAKDSYIWSCTSARAAWVITNSLPWFLLKSAQAKVLIQLQQEIDSTRQGRGRTVSDEQWEVRVALKQELHKLNAKGPGNQITVNLGEFTGE
jgi:hypothetical protein